MSLPTVLLCLALAVPVISPAQRFKVVDQRLFAPQQRTVFLLQDTLTDKKIILFRTKIQVNTDGTPMSYHPYDLHGETKAINTIGNAVAVRKKGSSKNLCLDRKTYKEAIRVFASYRDSGFEIVPEGYEITWKNVLAAERVGDIDKPCIIKTGPYAGYFGSLTSLTNGLTANRGECDCNNQVNPLEVPGLVLPGGNNALRNYGAKVGDLVAAYNPANDSLVYAIINDQGPAHNLGEGSVLLNMTLLGITEFPKSRKATYKLIPKNDVVIVIIPQSVNYERVRPYTAANVRKRVTEWFEAVGIHNKEDFKQLVSANGE
ncbi:hypothetical protein ACFQRK_22660 [Parapedobacter sp. GCM10030251]|uniref:hypothetical protein n=1 Tax=Parapedobacter sp. GCM10030251 TaxID=3273419 RepID=UPI00360D7811